MSYQSSARFILMGHRGTGKTSLIKRLRQYYQENKIDCHFFDLDQEIVQTTRQSIESIFSTHGENHFRKIERREFQNLSARIAELRGPVFLSVGAGFVPSLESDLKNQNIRAWKNQWPWKWIWVRRPTDAYGRIFLDRPRLYPSLGPLEESQHLYAIRNPVYQRWADQILTLQEGFDFPNETEKKWFLNPNLDLRNAAITLTKEAPLPVESQLTWKLHFLEFRDDLLSPAEIEKYLVELSGRSNPSEMKKILISFRNPKVISETRQILENNQNFPKLKFHFDWPAEWGICPWGSPWIYSLHTKRSTASSTSGLHDAITHLTQITAQASPMTLAKLAVPIQSFEELKLGHQWMSEKPHSRVFLPTSPTPSPTAYASSQRLRSKESRWKWYRLWMGDRMPFTFIREGEGATSDQPTVLEWLQRGLSPSQNQFAAVLGNPVEHSRTPAEQFSFFQKKGHPVFAIPLAEEEWPMGFPWLQKIGLTHAAVTSPLKLLASQETGSSPKNAINTLSWNSTLTQWEGKNTDAEGFRKVWESFLIKRQMPKSNPNPEIAIWGGGGTLDALLQALPRTAVSYSIRTGKPRFPASMEISPQIVIWAVGRSRWEETKRFPPEDWRPQWVIDLNYTEDSPGIEYSQNVRAQYLSGLSLFRFQAQGQREVWNSHPQANPRAFLPDGANTSLSDEFETYSSYNDRA